MTTAATMDEPMNRESTTLGMQFSTIRQQRGYTIEYVASKLHLRVRVVALIENGEFHLLPQPVFVKGYLRAYAKLLGVPPDPFLELFNTQQIIEKRPERALWQSKRETHRAEHLIRWFTILFAFFVLVAVGMWWGKNRDLQQNETPQEGKTDVSVSQNTESKITDLSRMQSILTPNPQRTPVLSENSGA